MLEVVSYSDHSRIFHTFLDFFLSHSLPSFSLEELTSKRAYLCSFIKYLVYYTIYSGGKHLGHEELGSMERWDCCSSNLLVDGYGGLRRCS